MSNHVLTKTAMKRVIKECFEKRAGIEQFIARFVHSPEGKQLLQALAGAAAGPVLGRLLFGTWNPYNAVLGAAVPVVGNILGGAASTLVPTIHERRLEKADPEAVRKLMDSINEFIRHLAANDIP